ncbi:hypothetical protein BDZ91DRAFT_753395 [Kalaharituber pfeilii]|nr:hypothetical protein BDZ91DRAFT_753395 [Kalaharituber pfeilii]
MIFGLFFFPTPMALRSCLFHQLLRKFVIASIPTVPLFVFNLPVDLYTPDSPSSYSTCPKYFLHNFSTIALIHAGGSRTVPRQIPRVRVPELLTVSRRILKILPNVPFCYSLAYRSMRRR